MVEEWSELDDFQSAQGTQFRLAAEALARGASREAVRVAYNGFGENIVPDLHKLRQHRVVLNMMAGRARRAIVCAGLSQERANEIMIGRMRASRDAIEGEWGRTETTQAGLGSVAGEKWVRLSLPIVNVEEPS